MRASVYIAISVDGFIARSDGDVSWLDRFNVDPSDDHGFGAFFETVDCMVMGRKTFETVLSFDVGWPYEDKRVVVLSSQRVVVPEALKDRVELGSGSPSDILSALAGRGYEHAYIDGGQTIRGFLAAGLVDSLVLSHIPILLGEGVSLFGGLPQERMLSHVSTQSFPSGIVQSEYRTAGGIADNRSAGAGAR